MKDYNRYINKTKKTYFLTFGILFLLATFSQILIQYFIHSQDTYANIINTSGKQRMLSQRILNFSRKLSRNYNKDYAADLEKTVKAFRRSHYTLRDGDKKRNISPPFTDEILQAYFELTPLVDDYSNAARCILNQCPTAHKAINFVEKYSDIFLVKMDRIVNKSTIYTEKRNTQLSRIELTAYISIIIVMLFEVFKILIPFNKNLIEMMRTKQLKHDKQRRLYHLAELGEINSEILHEINNYLTVAQANASMLESICKKKTDAEREKKLLTKLVQNLNKISGIGSGMRSLSRINLVGEFYIADLEEEINGLLQPSFKKHQVQFTFINNVAGKVISNKAQILQVIFNLIKNAIHALEDSQDKKILFLAEREDSIITIKVSDNGSGISEENRDKVLEAFFTTKETGKGTGLGLSLSKKIAKALGGDLILDHNTELTTFILSIEDQAKNK